MVIFIALPEDPSLLTGSEDALQNDLQIESPSWGRSNVNSSGALLDSPMILRNQVATTDWWSGPHVDFASFMEPLPLAGQTGDPTLASFPSEYLATEEQIRAPSAQDWLAALSANETDKQQATPNSHDCFTGDFSSTLTNGHVQHGETFTMDPPQAHIQRSSKPTEPPEPSPLRHSSPLPPPNRCPRFACTFNNCTRTFCSPSILQKHLDRHIKPYNCRAGCSKSFGSNHDRDRHEHIHLKEKALLCAEPGFQHSVLKEAFNRKDHLKAHLVRSGHRGIGYSDSGAQGSRDVDGERKADESVTGHQDLSEESSNSGVSVERVERLERELEQLKALMKER